MNNNNMNAGNQWNLKLGELGGIQAVPESVVVKVITKASKKYSTDAGFTWGKLDYGDVAIEITDLAAKYMAERGRIRGGAYATRLANLSYFIRHYIAEHDLWDARDILVGKREFDLPEIIGDSKPALFVKTLRSIVFKNHICDFYDWIIERDPAGRFGQWEDGFFVPLPNCRNPFVKVDYSGIPRLIESDKTPLPWKFIVELKELLAPGIHFSDWRWASGLLGKHGGTQSGDWFEVTDPEIIKLIDLKPGDPGYDPDLVSRRRLSPAYSNAGHIVQKWDPAMKKCYAFKREIVEIWSPMKTLAILMKLEICARTYQVRMLNSGETDLDRIELVDNIVNGKPVPEFVWRENPFREALLSGLPVEDRKRVTSRLGVFRPFSCRFSDDKLTGFYFTTNKTGDVGKDQNDRGYFVPWENKLLIRWLIKGRNWQEKYNPLKRPTFWSEGSARHYGVELSPADLAAFPPTCFLFRDASALNRPAIKASTDRWTERDSTLPLTKQALDKYWTHLLRAYQKQLNDRGVLVNGSPVNFIKKEHAKKSGATTYHPLHSLRVSLLSALAFDGKVPIAILMKMAGHANLIMTLYYTKLNQMSTNEEMKRAVGQMNQDAEVNYIKWMAQLTHDQISERMVVLDDQAMRSIVAEDPVERRPYTWLQVHDGWCLAGGNTTPGISSNRKMPGCYNGGRPLVGNGAQNADLHEAIPPRKCAECHCRWLLTGPAFLDALRAKFDSRGRVLSELESVRSLTELRLNTLKNARYDAQSCGQPYDSSELTRTQVLLERQEADCIAVLGHVSNIAHIVGRCVELMSSENDNVLGRQQVVALGSQNELKVAIETLDSELLSVDGICRDAEIYPELEADATASIYRRSQFFDKLFSRGNGQTPLMTFDRALQLRIGNEKTRKIIIAQEAELALAGKPVPQGARSILAIAFSAAENALKQGQGVPIYLRKALEDTGHSAANMTLGGGIKELYND